MLEYFVPVISFLGVLAGILLKRMAFEEVKFGKFGGRYFAWMRRIILFLFILVILSFSERIWMVVLGAIVGFLVGIFINEYLFLGVGLLIGFFASKEILLITSSLTFLYGLQYGSIHRRIRIKHIIGIGILFFVPLIFLLYPLPLSLLSGFAAGGFLNYLIRK